jgi:DNA-binding transcriptional LysR family regulator
MSDPGTPTFDQLQIFLAVVEHGSFAAAGRRLHRATSVISYGVSNLEAQLGVELFDREATRRPRLTEAGQAVLTEARKVAQGVDGLRAKVKGLLDGLEAEVHLAVDVMLPAARVGELLRAFAETFPTVSLRLSVEALGGVMGLVMDRRAVLGVSGPLPEEREEIERISIGAVEMIPVAAPGHPLARLETIAPGDTRDHIQLVLTDRSLLTEGRDFGVMSRRTWRLADLSAKHALLREGIGWGNMPSAMVEGDLGSGALVRLAMPESPGASYSLSAIYRRDTPPGPAASWLLRQFSRCPAQAFLSLEPEAAPAPFQLDRTLR